MHGANQLKLPDLGEFSKSKTLLYVRRTVAASSLPRQDLPYNFVDPTFRYIERYKWLELSPRAFYDHSALQVY